MVECDWKACGKGQGELNYSQLCEPTIAGCSLNQTVALDFADYPMSIS